jgi:hypothetical protein
MSVRREKKWDAVERPSRLLRGERENGGFF